MNDLLKRIHLDPKIVVGKPVIRGTRITVKALSRSGHALIGHLTVIEPHQVRSHPFKD